MKRLFLLLSCLLVPLSASLGELSKEDREALEAAGTFFPDFRASVYEDSDRAEKSFRRLVRMPEIVTTRLLKWLDDEYALRKTEFERALGGTGVTFVKSDNTAKIRELRAELEKLRKLDESEMKDGVEKGWDQLNTLLKLYKSDSRKIQKFAERDETLILATKTRAEQIGRFRQSLRTRLNLPPGDLEVELSDKKDAEEEAEFEASGKAGRVLRDNEKLKNEMPRAEYEGILELNQWRIAMGLSALEIDLKLCETGRDHSDDMAKLNFFAHESPVEGKNTPWDRAKNFKTTARGENIAINDSTEASNRAWFFSPGHHKNMFKADFNVIGLGITGRHYTQMFR